MVIKMTVTDTALPGVKIMQPRYFEDFRMEHFKKVIITGASGFIGGKLARRLLENDVKVYGIGRNIEKLNALKQYGDFIPVVADFTDYDKLPELIPERGFDMFWHFAWNGTSAKERAYAQAQAQAQAQAVLAAEAAVRLECASSSSSGSYDYYKTAINTTDDMYAFNPVYYGIAKRGAGDMFKAVAYNNGMNYHTLIIPNPFGPGDKVNTAIVFFIKSMLENKPLNLIPAHYKDDWIRIDTMLDGIIAAAASKMQYADYYIGHREITSFGEKIEKMKSVLGSNSELNFGAYQQNYFIDFDAIDREALFRDTGWEPADDFSESILQTAEWIKEQGIV
jgi:nucleoside-diphosphate-sugar epimerase